MIDPEERQSIINEAVETALLALPDVVGNLFASRAAMAKLTSTFYKDHPEFAMNKEAVASVIEMIEGHHPGMKYEDILQEAVPKIRERIAAMSALDMTTITKIPDRHLPRLKDMPPLDSKHGEL